MGLFELFELCAEASQPSADDRPSRAIPPRGRDDEGLRSLGARLFWPAVASAALVGIGLLQGFAAS